MYIYIIVYASFLSESMSQFSCLTLLQSYICYFQDWIHEACSAWRKLFSLPPHFFLIQSAGPVPDGDRSEGTVFTSSIDNPTGHRYSLPFCLSKACNLPCFFLQILSLLAKKISLFWVPYILHPTNTSCDDLGSEVAVCCAQSLSQLSTLTKLLPTSTSGEIQ